jgi:hypothetical protein
MDKRGWASNLPALGKGITVRTPRDLEKQVPKLHRVENLEFLTMPNLVGWLSERWISRVIHGVMGHLPFYRKLVLHLSYEF